MPANPQLKNFISLEEAQLYRALHIESQKLGVTN
jgi:hypothetical protein